MPTPTTPDPAPQPPAAALAVARPWHPEAPDGCRKCHRDDLPHYARGLCSTCYGWLARGNGVHFYPPVSTDRSVYANHHKLRADKLARLDRIARHVGPFITSTESIATPVERAPMPARGDLAPLGPPTRAAA